MHLEQKKEQLLSVLHAYGRVAIAFSGGTDSSLLAKCALDALGTENVLLLFAQSALLKPGEIERAVSWPFRHGYGQGLSLEKMELQPLTWEDFAVNRPDRCYCCKFRMYSLFAERMRLRGFSLLLDGTNADDLKSSRPGLRALQELAVKTPLVEAGIDKAEVRALSRRLRLASWQQPASSCLATRIPTGMAVTAERLKKIERWEAELESMGFAGCRVRLSDASAEMVLLEIMDNDFEKIKNKGILLAIRRFFQKDGIRKVLLDLEGR